MMGRRVVSPRRGQIDAVSASKPPAPGRRAISRDAQSSGMPDGLRTRAESLSGVSLRHVRVHRHSRRPEEFDAVACTDGEHIHLGPGQDGHLGHEAWHVVQQLQGRVKATGRVGDLKVNDDDAMEREADIMGRRVMAAAAPGFATATSRTVAANTRVGRAPGVVQLKKGLRARVREKVFREGIGSLRGRERRFAHDAGDGLAATRPSAHALQTEILKRTGRRQAELTSIAKGIHAGDRPDRPDVLGAKGVVPGRGTKKEDLTAHHLVPYNFIRDSFATAVHRQDLRAMQNLLAFSGEESTDSSEAFRALAHLRPRTPPTAVRPTLNPDEAQARGRGGRWEKELGIASYQKSEPVTSSADRLKGLFRNATWASHNVFMGPAPEFRADDPREGLDEQFRDDGSQTKASVMARTIHAEGFSGMDPTDFVSELQSARNEADGPATKKSGTVDLSAVKVAPAPGGPVNLHALVGADRHSENKVDYGSMFEPRPRAGGTRAYDPSQWEIERDGKLTQKGRKVRRK